MLFRSFNGHSVNAIANLGYRFNLAENWFLEPSVGVSYSRTHIDPLNISGTLILATSPGIAPPGTLTVSPFSSVLGRASLRVGTTFVSGGVAYQPFATFTILHEFASDVRARVASNFENAGVCFPFACGDPRNNLTTDVSV